MAAEVHRSPEADATRLDGRVRLGHQVAAARGELVEHPIAPGRTVRVTLQHQEAPPLLVKQPGAKMRAANVYRQNVFQGNLQVGRCRCLGAEWEF